MSIDWRKRIEERKAAARKTEENEKIRLAKEQVEAAQCLRKLDAMSLLESIKEQVWKCGHISLQNVQANNPDRPDKLLHKMSEREFEDYLSLPVLVGSVFASLRFSWPTFVAAGSQYRYGEEDSWPDYVATVQSDVLGIICAFRGQGKFALSVSNYRPNRFYLEDTAHPMSSMNTYFLFPELDNPQEVLIDLLERTLEQQPLKERVEQSVTELEGVLKNNPQFRDQHDDVKAWIQKYRKGTCTLLYDPSDNFTKLLPLGLHTS